MTELVADPAAAAEQRFLESLRARVAWQSERAAEQRTQVAAPAPTADVLDPEWLASLVETRPGDLRAPEWRAFLQELREIVEDDGRLPEMLERLVRVVFADLL